MDLATILSNDVFSGVIGGSLALSALYTLRGVPQRITQWVRWQFTAELTVFNDDSAFEHVAEWLGAHETAKETRRLRLTSRYSRHEQDDLLGVSPGIGYHLLWHGSRPVLVSREMPQNNLAYKQSEVIRIWTLGRSPAPLRQIVREIVALQNGAASDSVEVFLWRDYWRLGSRKQKRTLDSVILPDGQRDRIVADLEAFTAARSWYVDRGIPYRRGLLLHGPAGCGKTSLALALAGHLGRRVYALNLGSLNGDDALLEAVSLVPENAILLIEDIDAAQTHRKTATSGNGKNEERRPITMSALLNAIDGVFARDGRILVMTTNHVDRIDPALLRPGRADLTEEIAEFGEPEVRQMCRRFGVGGLAACILTPVTPAEVQRRLLEHCADERSLH